MKPNQTLEEKMPRCKTKDVHDFPDLKDGERCYNCELWDDIDEYAQSMVVEELERVEREVIGEDDHYDDMCEHCNDWDEGRNSLRAEQHKKLAAIKSQGSKEDE